ncbi:MAG: hypothetical protein AABX75_02115 [Nanoarchaeota archaeon]
MKRGSRAWIQSEQCSDAQQNLWILLVKQNYDFANPRSQGEV